MLKSIVMWSRLDLFTNNVNVYAPLSNSPYKLDQLYVFLIVFLLGCFSFIAVSSGKISDILGTSLDMYCCVGNTAGIEFLLLSSFEIGVYTIVFS